MALVFTDDGGSNTSPYETWAKAATTFLVAVDFASAGDVLIIGHDHTESPGGNTTYDFPGTHAAPNVAISATSSAGGSTIVYNKADNIQIDLSTSTHDITLTGVADLWGFSIKVGDDATTGVTNSIINFYDSLIEFSGTSARWLMGTTNGKNITRLIDTVIDISGGGTSIFGFASTGRFEWRGGTLLHSGDQPVALFDISLSEFHAYVSGVDLSSLTSAIVDVSDGGYLIIGLHHCLINSSVSLTTGTHTNSGTVIFMSGCDDTTGNDLYRLEYVDYWGSTVHDDTIFLNASDGTQGISWKMVTTANAVEFNEPTVSPPIPGIWIDATGSTTITVNMVWDSASDIQDDEAWIEVEYLEASADTDSAFSDDRMADISATPVDQDNNTEDWTGADGFSNKNRQELATTVTINRVGPIVVRVYLAKPSTTIYVDPKVVIS